MFVRVRMCAARAQAQWQRTIPAHGRASHRTAAHFDSFPDNYIHWRCAQLLMPDGTVQRPP